MGRSRKNFLSLLENDKVVIFCAFDKDYNVFRAKVYSENLFYHLGFKDIKKCVFMDQIHSHKVIIYEKNLKNLSCDGLISKEKNIALCVLSADCLPLILYHESGIIAALHSGRKGSFENILKECVDQITMQNSHLDKNKFHLFILPGICAKNYEIDGEILEF
ncbi:laccase, partial [Campylobacter jejuni]|nr:laccase [Campylobacter jejuni]